MSECILVGIGGFAGSVLRYLVGLVPAENDNGFPVKTLMINVAGAFAIGLIAALAEKWKICDPRMILMLKVGVCGGFTTFSTFAFESAELIKSGSILTAVSYMALSLVLGIGAVFISQAVVR